MSYLFCYFFFFKQKTAYEMRISDWSSDVCSSDLMGGSHTLPRLIGPTLARDLYLTSRSVDAEEALRIGLVSEIAADEECLPPAIARAREIAAGPRRPYRYIKQRQSVV